MKQEDKDYWVGAYQRILGVRPETFNKAFDTDSLEDKLKEFIKKYPNDQELGSKIRLFIQEEINVKKL